MKTYITPNTEYMATVKSGILCDSGSGAGQFDDPEKQGGGNDAPRRRVF